jgi:SWI/SNF chromatin-remodeling complex subunit SWI1
MPRTRRKITYVPLAREIDTAGGWSAATLGPDLQRALQRRQLKSIHEWGMVDVDALIMSIRSRLATELSYALTTCSLLSVVRDSAKDVPYLTVSQCSDLFDELLDLLEEVAFEGVEEVDEFEGCEHDVAFTRQITTMRDLINLVQEQETKPFASLDSHRPGISNPELGPKQRPGAIILTVINIMRNWAAACTENLDFMARHPTVLSIMLRVASIASRKTDPVIRPASPALTLSDLTTVRKDVLYILFGITTELRLKDIYEKTPVMATRMTRRILELVSSSLMDPVEACVPSAHTTVPYVADTALQIWTRFSQPDDHRRIICNVIPQEWLWQLFQVLIYRLPVTTKDYEVITKDTWLSYMEKLMMAIYSLVFLSPPELKRKFKTNKRLGFPGLMLRMIRRFTTNQNQNVREFFSVCARRAIEAMKLVDDEGDMFDTAPTTGPALSFGVGYGEAGEKTVEKGSGMFGGYAEDITFTIMLAREVDNIMFGELESMVRVEF